MDTALGRRRSFCAGGCEPARLLVRTVLSTAVNLAPAGPSAAALTAAVFAPADRPRLLARVSLGDGSPAVKAVSRPTDRLRLRVTRAWSAAAPVVPEDLRVGAPAMMAGVAGVAGRREPPLQPASSDSSVLAAARMPEVDAARVMRTPLPAISQYRPESCTV